MKTVVLYYRKRFAVVNRVGRDQLKNPFKRILRAEIDHDVRAATASKTKSLDAGSENGTEKEPGTTPKVSQTKPPPPS